MLLLLFFVSVTLAATPFPDWLKQLTNLTKWPGLEPPFIPVVSLSGIPDTNRYRHERCNPLRLFPPLTHERNCSFDCDGCCAADDIYSCPRFTQTFDDGPSKATIKLLNNFKGKTNFFTIGINVIEHPDIFSRIVNEGHFVGSHTWSHKHLPSLSNEEAAAQLQWSIWAMNATCGYVPRYFRPPYGGMDNRIRLIAERFGLKPIVWNFDTFDWQLSKGKITNEEILKNVYEWKQKYTEGIILEHDTAIENVDIALQINKIVGTDQMRVDQCKGVSQKALPIAKNKIKTKKKADYEFY